MLNSFGSRSSLRVGGRELAYHSFRALERAGHDVTRLPFSLRILLENLLRLEDGKVVDRGHIEALLRWEPKAAPDTEIAFMPARVLLQDFTGVPAVVDLAAMRDAIKRMGGDPNRINPLFPAELVIDHSVQVDEAGHAQALTLNNQIEFDRNRERYAFLRWGQTAFRNFSVVPPDTGIVHQVNLEYLARVVFTAADPRDPSELWAYPDTLVGTDSHTTMVNGLGVLGWGVGGIEAEAAMLGQPMPMLIPQVVGFKLAGSLREGATATDLVLTVTEMLRKRGVVGKFVEFFGPGLPALPLADRATIANMAPEYGATCGIFPVDDETLRYLRLTGRSAEQIALVEAYCKEQGLFAGPGTPEAEYSEVLELDLGAVEPSLAGPKRPQDRVRAVGREAFVRDRPALAGQAQEAGRAGSAERRRRRRPTPATPNLKTRLGGDRRHHQLHQHLQPVGDAGRRPAGQEGGRARPGQQAVGEDHAGARLEGGDRLPRRGRADALPGAAALPDRGLRLHHLHRQLRPAARRHLRRPSRASDLVVASVLSGNRNFEGRVHPEVRANYLMSPPLVVAYALAGRVDIDFDSEPLGDDKDGKPVFLKDIWPTSAEVSAGGRPGHQARDVQRRPTPACSTGDASGRACRCRTGATYAWDPASTYIKHPPYFEGMTREPGRSRTSTAPGCWRCWATASPPTTSRRRARSRRTAPRAST